MANRRSGRSAPQHQPPTHPPRRPGAKSAMTRPTQLQAAPTAKHAVWREKTGTPPTADTVDLADPLYDVAAAKNLRAYETVIIGVEFVSSSGTPSAVLELLFYSEEGTPVWRRLMSENSAITTGTIVPGQDVELNVYGHSLIFPRIHTITDGAGVTTVRIIARGGKLRRPN